MANKKDWRARVVEEVNANPLFRAAALGIGVAILGLTYASQTATPERRARLNERLRREREDKRRSMEQRSLRDRLWKDYFEQSEGKALYEREAYVVVPAGRPPADASFEMTRDGRGFEARSESAGLRLSLQHDYREAITSVFISRRGGQQRNGYGGIAGSTLAISPMSPHPGTDFEGWIEDARLMAGLIAAPGSPIARIRLRRPDASEIKQRLWLDHLRRHPDIAAATGEAWRVRL